MSDAQQSCALRQLRARHSGRTMRWQVGKGNQHSGDACKLRLVGVRGFVARPADGDRKKPGQPSKARGMLRARTRTDRPGHTAPNSHAHAATLLLRQLPTRLPAALPSHMCQAAATCARHRQHRRTRERRVKSRWRQHARTVHVDSPILALVPIDTCCY